MPNREKVIKGLEICVDRIPGKYTCNECPYEIDGNYCEINLTHDAIDMLKEQQEEIENLKQTAQSMMEGICLLKEQEAVVRCKDCKFMYEDGQFMCGIRGFCVNEDFFCADGERK